MSRKIYLLDDDSVNANCSECECEQQEQGIHLATYLVVYVDDGAAQFQVAKYEERALCLDCATEIQEDD